jgi:uncharacterized protein (TIGR02266 family)
MGASPQAPEDPRELRRHARRPVEINITLESESQLYTGFSENFSDGGVFVATHMLRPVGARLEVTFTIPGLASPIRVDGEVRWVREVSDTSDLPAGMGLKFGSLRPEEAEAVRRFAASRSPIFFVE